MRHVFHKGSKQDRGKQKSTNKKLRENIMKISVHNQRFEGRNSDVQAEKTQAIEV